MGAALQALYSLDMPTHQNAVDIFKGFWKSAFPEESKLEAGSVANFQDKRVDWVDHKLGGLNGKSILELGPYEAYDTYQFSQLRAGSITAIEGNNINYLKCLVVKEVLGIQSQFLYEDINTYLENSSEHYDICWASGVL
tara:strand:+ start:104 stop:520 length:417 start_codon:yes stop_codon:yes gene_type:complete